MISTKKFKKIYQAFTPFLNLFKALYGVKYSLFLSLENKISGFLENKNKSSKICYLFKIYKKFKILLKIHFQ